MTQILPIPKIIFGVSHTLSEKLPLTPKQDANFRYTWQYKHPTDQHNYLLISHIQKLINNS
jgi:hypothetical protein